MNQPFDEELISAYLDDELSDEERRDVERLLTERPEAQRLLDELRGLRESLQSLPTFKLQDDFGAAVLRRAEREMLRTGTATSPASSPTGEAAAVTFPATVVSSTTGAAAGNAVQPAADVARNWRRPAMWSILAVAAAALLMFVDRSAHDAQHVAMNRAAEQTGDRNRDEQIAASPRAPGEKNGSRDGAVQLGETALRPMSKPAELAARSDDALRKSASNDSPAVVTSAVEADAAIAKNAVAASQPTPTTNHLAVTNGVLSVPNNHMVMSNSTVPKAMPPLPAPSATGALFAVDNPGVPAAATLGGAGMNYGGAPPAGAAGGFGGGGGAGGSFGGAGAQNPLASQVLTGAGLNALPAQQQLGVVDVTPLIQSNDYQRARALVSEYEVARREGRDERGAAADLPRRIQSRAQEMQRQSQPVPSPTKAGDAVAQFGDRFRGAADQLLIVYCDVTADALERGWTPIVNREQVADLTTPTLGTGTINGVLQQAPAQRAQPKAGDEEFVYLVADSKQLEATLDSLRRESAYFLNVRVEPAAADARQSAWRSRYSRGEETGGANAYSVKNAPTAANPSPSSASQSETLGGAAPTVPPPGMLAGKPTAPSTPPMKTAEEVEKLKLRGDQDGDKNRVAGVKSENVGQVGRPLNELPQLSKSGAEVFGGGNAPSGAASEPLLAPTATPPAAAPNLGTGPAQLYSQYAQRSSAPLSRYQRLNREDVYDSDAEGTSQLVLDRAPTAPAAAPAGAPVAAASKSGEAARENKQVAPPAPGSAAPAPMTPVAPPAVAAAPAASTPADASADKKMEQAKQADVAGTAGGGSAPKALSPSAAERSGIAQKEVEVAAKSQASAEPAANQPAAPSEPQVWYGLPPDYHEALFIFRVVDAPKADAKPAAKSAK